jgi:hypothetical protein
VIQTQSSKLLALFQENIRFCIISTRMEDALAISPIIPESKLAALDNSFVNWFRNSSVQNTSPLPCSQEPPGLTVAKNVMRWRYLSSRVILHRPILLWYAMRRIQFSALSQKQKTAVQLCRDVTNDLINDIAITWQAQRPCVISGWNATWLLYQAVMVPLLSLFLDLEDHAVLERARHQVDVTLTTLTDLHSWSPTAKRSFEVVSRIYDASKRHSGDLSDSTATSGDEFQGVDLGYIMANNPFFLPVLIDTNPVNVKQELLMDNMFYSPSSSAGWSNLDYPFDSTPSTGMGWDYAAMDGWGGGLGGGQFDRAFVEGMQTNGNTRMLFGYL